MHIEHNCDWIHEMIFVRVEVANVDQNLSVD